MSNIHRICIHLEYKLLSFMSIRSNFMLLSIPELDSTEIQWIPSTKVWVGQKLLPTQHLFSKLPKKGIFCKSNRMLTKCIHTNRPFGWMISTVCINISIEKKTFHIQTSISISQIGFLAHKSLEKTMCVPYIRREREEKRRGERENHLR